MFHRATILHVVERLAFKRVHESSGGGELQIRGMPLRTISFLDFAAKAVATSLEVDFGEQAHVLLISDIAGRRVRPIFESGRIVKLPDKELRFFVSGERCSSLNNFEL